jgi:type VI secretion system secreted protein Hcp
MADAIVLEITGIDGECKLEGYDKKITLTSFSHGLQQPMTMDPSNQERTTGRVNCQDLSFTKQMDAATIHLLNAINTAKNLQTTKLYILKATGEEAEGQKLVLTIEMENTMISSYSLSGGGGVPMESISFNFTKISWNYTPQTETGALGGNIPTNWNLAKGKKD